MQSDAKVSARMASFSGFIGGHWKMTSLAGTDTYDTWHWGPERNSIRSMRFGTLPDGDPWGTMTAYYWHPSRKEVRMLGVCSVFRGVSEGTITFDGSKAEGTFDHHQLAGTRELGLRWKFDGPDTFHDQLLEKGPRGYELMVEWDRHRVAAVSADERAAPKDVMLVERPSKLLSPLAKLLGAVWQTQAKPGAAAPRSVGDLPVRASFEYVPHVDAIFGRVQTLDAGGTPSHAMDLYLYHHTRARALRCLVLAIDDAGEAIVSEVDVTPIDSGRSLRLDVREQRSGGVSALEARIDFEAARVGVGAERALRVRLWKTDGQERSVFVDLLLHPASE
ncbi:MAG: hypothetical protein ACKVS9_09650 [Phycisphaerae bacterium]